VLGTEFSSSARMNPGAREEPRQRARELGGEAALFPDPFDPDLLINFPLSPDPDRIGSFLVNYYRSRTD